MAQLPIHAFKVLRRAFFDEHGDPIEFPLRDKRNTQDDPFDEYVAQLLNDGTPDDVSCEQAPGPLITPDMALIRPAQCANASRDDLSRDLEKIMGIEVKKLERGASGAIARASGLDYNTTPPCGTVRTYDASGEPLHIRAFYLFVCLERTERGRNMLTALALCDGNALNADFEYYLSIAGERTKEINLGTYGDGANRNRPMVIFGNPLGATVLDHEVTLVHESDDLAEEDESIRHAGSIRRTIPNNGTATFHCYRLATDNCPGFEETDPFPTPRGRTERTTGRGRFTLPVHPVG